MDHGLEGIIKTVGYVGIFAIIFAETGLFFGFLLPGDSLLFTAGLLASQGYFSLPLLCAILFVAAVIGDSTGYAIGNKFGKRLYQTKDSFFFRKEHLEAAHSFYLKHGGKTIILARFMPIIRTFAPTVAGIADMPYKTFLSYNIIGALLWAVGLTVCGFFLGKVIPDVDKYLLPIILLIIIVSIAPGMYELLKTKEKRQNLLSTLSRLIKRS